MLPSRSSLFGGLSLLSVALGGCGEPEAERGSHVEVVGTSRSALQHKDDLRSLNGTYGAGCTQVGSWSLPIGASTDGLVHPVLTMIPRDDGCVLTLTELVATSELDPATLIHPKLDPPIALSREWAKEHSQLSVDGAIVHANARLELGDRPDEFAIVLVVSDDPTADATASPSHGGVETGRVASADYRLSLGGPGDTDGVALVLDAASRVHSVSGRATLTEGAHPGDHYVIDRGALPPGGPPWSFEMLRAAYDGEAEHVIEGPHSTISAEQFGLVGEDLTSDVQRTVIVSRTEHGVRSFQALSVRFARPR